MGFPVDIDEERTNHIWGQKGKEEAFKTSLWRDVESGGR
jgi:hypothetical protein